MSPPVFVETSHALPFVSAVISFRSGSAHDPLGKEGLARITARMLRRGARGWSSQAIESTVDALGGQFAADVTPSSSAVHFEVIRRSLEPLSDLVAIILGEPVFDEQELSRLKRESEAEIIESRDSDPVLAIRAFRRTLFDGHPYGRRASGTIASVRSITRSDVEAFYSRHYTRENAVVAVSGDIEAHEAKALIEKILARLPAGEPVADPVPPPAAKPGRHLVFVDKPERTQTQMVIGGLGTHARDLDHTPLIVASTVFGGTFTSRLMQEIRAKRGWSYGAYARIGVDRQRESFTMWSAPAATDAAACMALKLSLLEAWRKDGITGEELEFVKRYLIRSHAFEIDTARKRVHQPLEEMLFDLPEGYYARHVEHVEAVTRDAANESITRRISEDDLVIGVVGTHSEIGDAIVKAIPRLSDVTVVPFDLE